VLTDIGEADTIAEAKRLGAIGYLIKVDFSPEQLLEEVKKRL
jgi:DNA-binding NarL/FixJ family response regulator